MAMAFDKFRVTIKFLEPILGTVPTDSTNYEQFIKPKANGLMSEEEIKVLPQYRDAAEARKRAKADDDRAKKRARKEEDNDDAEESPNKPQTSFFRDGQGPFLLNYQLLGHLKEQGNLLKEQLNIKALRHKVELYCYVYPRRVHFGQEIAGELTRPLRAETMRGPRVMLATSDVVDKGTEMSFEIHVLKNKEVDGDTVRSLLDFGQHRGIGQWRSGGFGVYEVIRFELMEDSSSVATI